MELKDQLDYCRKCQKRELNSVGTLLCGLTHHKLVFEGIECRNYVRDESEPDKYLDDEYSLSFGEMREKLDSTVYEKFRMDQNLFHAIAFGLLASIVGAVVWALISYLTGYQIGYMAVAIGALVGFAIKRFGKGFELPFAIAGAVIALFGCLLGNLLTVMVFACKEYNVGFVQILGLLSFELVGKVMVESFKFMDIIFYGIAIYEGFRFSAMRFSEKALWAYTRKYK
jgi:hypothetical protein